MASRPFRESNAGFRAPGSRRLVSLRTRRNWAYDPVKQKPSADCSHNVRYLERIMRDFDMGDLQE